MALSGDGKLIFSGSRDRRVRRWDEETSESMGKTLRGQEGCARSVAVSGDGKLIVPGSDDETVRRWDEETGTSVGNPLPRHNDWVIALVVSGDGKFVFSGPGMGQCEGGMGRLG